MDKSITPYWRWSLPDDWEPEGVWCVVVHIPAGEQYVEALAGALGLLTVQKYWQRDATRTGAKTVAATWRAALYSAELQIIDCPIIVPTPEIPDQEAADDAAAAIIQILFEWVVTEMIDCIDQEVERDECVQNLMVILGPYYAGEEARTALENTFDALAEAEAGLRATYATDCPYQGEFNDLRDMIANDESWLDNLSDWLFDWLNQTSDEILIGLNNLGVALTGQGIINWINRQGGIPEGGGAGFGGGCTWEVTFDFTIDAQGWEHIPDRFNGIDVGQYQSGTGWVVTTEDVNESTQVTGISVVLHTEPIHLVGIEWSLDRHEGFIAVGAYDYAASFGDDWIETSTQTSGEGDAIVLTNMFDFGIQDEFRLGMYTQFGAFGPYGSGRAIYVKLFGEGRNPFA
jgi:hypothetical protein